MNGWNRHFPSLWNGLRIGLVVCSILGGISVYWLDRPNKTLNLNREGYIAYANRFAAGVDPGTVHGQNPIRSLRLSLELANAHHITGSLRVVLAGVDPQRIADGEATAVLDLPASATPALPGSGIVEIRPGVTAEALPPKGQRTFDTRQIRLTVKSATNPQQLIARFQNPVELRFRHELSAAAGKVRLGKSLFRVVLASSSFDPTPPDDQSKYSAVPVVGELRLPLEGDRDFDNDLVSPEPAENGFRERRWAVPNDAEGLLVEAGVSDTSVTAQADFGRQSFFVALGFVLAFAVPRRRTPPRRSRSDMGEGST